MSSDYLDVDCETRPDLKGQVEKLTVRDGLYRLIDPHTCDNPAEMRQWHRVIISVPYHDHADLWDTIDKYLYQDDHDDQTEYEHGVIMGHRWLYEPISTRTQFVPMGNNQWAQMPVMEDTIQDREFYVRDSALVTGLKLLWPNNVKIWWGESRERVTESVYNELFG